MGYYSVHNGSLSADKAPLQHTEHHMNGVLKWKLFWFDILINIKSLITIYGTSESFGD